MASLMRGVVMEKCQKCGHNLAYGPTKFTALYVVEAQWNKFHIHAKSVVVIKYMVGGVITAPSAGKREMTPTHRKDGLSPRELNMILSNTFGSGWLTFWGWSLRVRWGMRAGCWRKSNSLWRVIKLALLQLEIAEDGWKSLDATGYTKMHLW